MAVVLGMLVLACDRAPADSPAPEVITSRVPDSDPEMPAPATAARSEATAAAATPATKDFLEVATAQPRPTLVGPLGPLRLAPDLTLRKARRQAPWLFERMPEGRLTGPFVYASAEWPSVSFETEIDGQIDTDLDTWLVGELRVILPRAGAAERLMVAWGEPRVSGNRRTWVDPEARLRAVLHDASGTGDTVTLGFGGYTPLAELIGSDPALFGFEQGKPILGTTGAELLKRYGRRIHDYSAIHLWPTEHADEIVVRFASAFELGGEEDLAEHVVEGYTVTLPAGDEVARLLKAKLGPPKPDREDEHVQVYRKTPRVTFDGSELTVGKPLEL